MLKFNNEFNSDCFSQQVLSSPSQNRPHTLKWIYLEDYYAERERERGLKGEREGLKVFHKVSQVYFLFAPFLFI